MIQRITPQMRRKWDKRIAYCLEHSEEMNEWEVSFINSLEVQRAAEKDLSFRQVQKLYQIYKKVEEKT